MTDNFNSNAGRAIPVAVLFEDGDVLAVTKPEGLASIPERSEKAESLLFVLQAARDAKLFVVHRLDKEASGAILFAKNAGAHRCLNRQFERREIAKTYTALAHGRLESDGGTIDRPIRMFGSGRMGIDEARGKPSATAFEVSRRFGAYTLLEARPASGRRHQIRVHLYSLGHPIVGDARYGDRTLQARYPRLMLHASAIAFRLPSGELMSVSSPLPATFVSVLESVEA